MLEPALQPSSIRCQGASLGFFGDLLAVEFLHLLLWTAFKADANSSADRYSESDDDDSNKCEK